MTLEDIFYISQIVAVIAIFASLIFVGVQVRQHSEQIRANTRSIKASAVHEGLHSLWTPRRFTTTARRRAKRSRKAGCSGGFLMVSMPVVLSNAPWQQAVGNFGDD